MKQATNADATHANEDRLLFLMSATPAIIYALCASGDYAVTFISPNVQIILGCSPEAFLMNPGFWASRVHPDDLPAATAGFTQMAVMDRIIREYRFCHGNGSYRWMQDETKLTRDEQGQPRELIGYWLDITERKLVEQQLRESRERYALAEQATQDGLWDWNILTGAEYYSPRYLEILGLQPDELPGDRSAFLNRLHPDDLPVVNEITREHLATGRRYEVEFRLRHQDGSYRWLCSRGEAVRDAAHRPIRMVGAITEITERKRLQTEIIRTNYWLANTQRISQIGGWAFNLKTGEVWVSPEARRIYGARADTPLTLSSIQSFPLQQYRPGLDQALQDLVAGRAPYDMEFQIARGDDGAIVDIHSVAECDAAGSTVMGVIEDITARKRSEQSLRASEARYRNIVETSEEGVWLVDAGWRTTFTNRRLEEMFGYEPGKMLGRPITDFMDESSRNVAVKLEHRREEGVRETHDFKFIRPNGEELWTMIATNPVFDDAGVFAGALAMVTDITTRKQQEIFSEMGREVLQILNEPADLKSAIHRVVATLKRLASFDAVGIRLRAGHDFPYFAQEGFNEDFLLTENSLAARTPEGALCRDQDGRVALECTCGLVLSGQTKPDCPLFTTRGSFWTNDSPALLALPSAQDPRRHPRNRCIHQGYASVLLAPIRNGEQILGLLQLNARRKGGFTPNMVAQVEEIAGQIGLSLIRKHAEIARGESEEKFAKMFQSSPTAISLSTVREGRLLDVNAEYLRMFERTREEVIGRTSFDLGLWTDPAQRTVLAEQLNQNSFVRNFELELRAKSGRIHHVLWSGEVLFMAGERCVLGSALDITERKAAELAREQERQLLRILIDHIPDMIYVRDVDNRFLAANQAFARHMGVATATELLGRSDADFYPASVAERYAATDRKIFAGQELVNYDCLIEFPNGERLNVLNTKIPLKDHEGKVVGLVGVCRDVTDQKHAAQASARLAAIVESSSDGIIGKDLQGVITSWNPGAEKLFGYTASEIVGNSIRRLIPADRQKEEDEILERIRRGESVTHFDTVRLTKDGKPMDVSVTASPIKDAAGQVIGVSKTIRDITARKLADQKLRENEERYRQLFELESDAIFLVDAETHRFEDVNQSAEELYGYRREEFRALQAEAVSAEPDKTRRNIASGRYQVPLRWHRKKDGTLFPVEITANLIEFQGRRFELTAVRDITARQMAYAQLQETTAQLLDAQKLASLGSYVFDVVTGQWTSSQVLDQLFGIADAGFVKDVNGWLEIAHPEERAGLRQYLAEQVLKNKGEFDRTYRIVRLDDRQERWVHGIGKLMLDEAGKVLRMIGVIQDVTERQRTELALTFQNRLSQVLLGLPSLADHLDEHAFVQKALKQLETITGSQISYVRFVHDGENTGELVTWSRRTVEQYCQSVGDRHDPVGQADLWAEALRQRRPVVINDYAAHLHQQGLPAGPSELNRLVSLPVLENEKVVMLLGVGNKQQDYTEGDVNAVEHVANLVWRLTQQRRAAAARTRLAIAVDQAAESVVITDTNGDIVYVNPAFEKTTGYTRAEVLGQNPRVLKSGKQDAGFYKQVWDTLLRGEAWTGHFINKRKDGTHYEEEATISPIRDAQGALVNFVAVKRDVTREVQLEAQFRQTQKLEAIGTLAGGIAHDFNNILGAMSGYAYLLGEDVAENPSARESVAEIQTAVQRAKDLVQQILTFSRQREQNRRVIQLGTVVKETMKFLRASLPAQIKIELQLAPDTPSVLADPTQIYQVVMNLGTNALHAMEAAGGRLTLKLEPFLPDAGFLAAHPEFRAIPYARVTVADTGQGMDARTLERIYEPFFTTKPVGKGTGLGLAVVHGIIQSHDGVITVESRVGQGTTFCLYFPAQLEVEARSEDQTVAIQPGSGQRILLVDDEPALTAVLQRSLSRMHYQVTPSNQPEAALRLFAASPGEFDLVVTDLTMPGMSGLDLGRRLRVLRPGLPVILMSGYSVSVTHEMLAEAGIGELLAKPVSPSTLAEAVQRALAKA